MDGYDLRSLVGGDRMLVMNQRRCRYCKNITSFVQCESFGMLVFGKINLIGFVLSGRNVEFFFS